MKLLKKFATVGVAAALYSTTSLLYCMTENPNIRGYLANYIEDTPRYMLMAPVSLTQRMLGRKSSYKEIMDQEGGENCFFDRYSDNIENKNLFGGPESERFFYYTDPETGKTQRYFLKVDQKTVAKFEDCKAIPLTEREARIYAGPMALTPASKRVKNRLSDVVAESERAGIGADDWSKSLSLEELIKRKGAISGLLANEKRFNGSYVPALEHTLKVINNEINSRSEGDDKPDCNYPEEEPSLKYKPSASESDKRVVIDDSVTVIVQPSETKAPEQEHPVQESGHREALSVYEGMNGQIKSLYQGERKIYDSSEDNWEPRVIKDEYGVIKKVYKGTRLIYEDQ